MLGWFGEAVASVSAASASQESGVFERYNKLLQLALG